MIYVINLDRRKDRMERVAKQLAKLRQPFVRFSAVETLDRNGFVSEGGHGCALSHLAVVKSAIDQDLDTVTIFEDDVILRDDAERIVSNAIAQLPINWHMLHLGCLASAQIPFSKALTTPINPRHLHAYILSRAGMKWLQSRWSELINSAHGKLPLDRFIEQDDVPRFKTHPTCAIQEDGYSDIRNDYVLRMRDYFSGADTFEKFAAHTEELKHERSIAYDEGST
jgi:GR25 family glycosyltransferase involved in LPS biosynthesis